MKKMSQPVYSVVIPVYNSTESLIELSQRLGHVFSESIHAPYEIIFIDDYSSLPETWITLTKLVDSNPHIIAIQLQRNFGKANAVFCGFNYVSGDYIVMMDDDLQHAPEDIPLLIQAQAHDVVMASFHRKNHNLQQKLTSAINNWLEHASLGKPVHIQSSPFALLKRSIVQGILQTRSPYPNISALVYYTTHDIVNVSVGHQSRQYGKSNFSIAKRWELFANLIINNSNFGLRILRYGGMAIFLISVLMSAFYIFRRLFYDVLIPGFTTLVTLNLLLGGLTLLSLGIIGEYIYRLLVNVERKQPYIIRTVLQRHKDDIQHPDFPTE